MNTIVSSKEFVSNEDKYFDLALREQVFIQKDNNVFIVTIVNNYDDDDTDYDDDPADLALAAERLNGEFTSADEFISYLRKWLQ